VKLASKPAVTPKVKRSSDGVPRTPEADFDRRVNGNLPEWEGSRRLVLQTFSNAFFDKHGVRPIGPALEQRFEALFPEWKRTFIRTADGTPLAGLDLSTEEGLRRWESEYLENRTVYQRTVASFRDGNSVEVDTASVDEQFQKSNPHWRPRYKQVVSAPRPSPGRSVIAEASEVGSDSSAVKQSGDGVNAVTGSTAEPGREPVPPVGIRFEHYVDDILVFIGSDGRTGIPSELGGDVDNGAGSPGRDHVSRRILQDLLPIEGGAGGSVGRGRGHRGHDPTV
jgi:hypothetical protein